MSGKQPDFRLTFPSEADYGNRVQLARDAMRQHGVDVLTLSGIDYHRFFTGLNGLPVGRPIWLVLLQNGSPVFVSPRSEVKEIRARCATPVAAEWVEWEGPVPAPMTHQDALAKYIAEIAPDARTIGVDFNSTWGLNIEAVKQSLGAERVRDATGWLRGLLAIKDTVAIDVIRRCTDIVSHQIRACQEIIAPGVPEWKVALTSFNAATQRSAEWWNGDEEQSPFVQGLQMMGSGHERTARCHSAGGGRIMQDGEVLQICFCGPSFFGHAIGYDRPFHIGSKPLSPEMRKVVDIARAAQEAAIAAARPGAKASEVHAAAVAMIESGGWDNPFLHRTGRGIGYSDFDGLELKAGSETVLKPGMVMTIEPAPYVDGIGGARFGDTVLITEDGCEVLTPFELGRDI